MSAAEIIIRSGLSIVVLGLAFAGIASAEREQQEFSSGRRACSNAAWRWIKVAFGGAAMAVTGIIWSIAAP